MKKTRYNVVLVMILLASLCVNAMAVENQFEKLQPGGSFNGFVAQNLYLNGKDEPIGARLIHQKTGFTLDLFSIQSVPQAFLWVNSLPEDDMGEPHTCEHLLLGKGTKGRYVASLENMSLGQSTAYTSQIYTAFPFSSQGGNDVFYTLLNAKLDAMLHPNFSDEEIRREVCHIGLTQDPATGALKLDEKGTVYNEMVSSFEQYWYPLFGTLGDMTYGADHPLAHNSGGMPAAIRKMQPTDLRTFHSRAYHLNNMGAIVTIPGEVTTGDLLKGVDVILNQVEGTDQAIPQSPVRIQLPPAHTDVPQGEIRLTAYPGSSAQEPGQIAFAWPAQLDYDLKEGMLLNLFLYCLGGSQTSNLYNKLINSNTRIMDLGASDVWANASDDIGHSISVGIADVKPELIDKDKIAGLAGTIQDEIKVIAEYKPGSKELIDFNSRAASALKDTRKRWENYLNTPPGFGDRNGSGGGWYDLMHRLESEKGFKKSLIFKNEMLYAAAELQKKENIWTPLIAKWKLLDTQPYAVGCKADPALMTKAVADKQQRLADYTALLRKRYNVDSDSVAILKYKEEYDRNTAVIDSEAAKVPLPKFLDKPPMTLDALLDYKVDTLAGTIPLVASTFNSLTSATVGIALRADVIPEDKLLYLPILPDLITEIGVVKDGKTIDYAAMTDRLKNEILSLNSYLSASYTTGRVELQVTGAGGNIEESKRALEWMNAGLCHPYLDMANLPRIRDVVNNRLQGLHNRMKNSEEAWVSSPAFSYRYQNNHLVLAANSFLTQEHFVHRLRWRLMGGVEKQDMEAAGTLFDNLAALAAGKSQDELVKFAVAYKSGDSGAASMPVLGGFVAQVKQAPPSVQKIMVEALSDLASAIPLTPPENAAGDWAYLAGQMKADLAYGPEKTLADLSATLGMLRLQKNARMFIISNGDDCRQLMAPMETLVAGLDKTSVPSRQKYSNAPIVLNRMKERYKDLVKPTYMGLVNENTRNGVFYFLTPCCYITDTSEDKILDFLAAKIYGGGGSHSMFMKTWGAGLAYSNGLRSSELSGFLTYYAERCPDLSATMRFVAGQLKAAPYDAKLADYAIALAFGTNRAADSYESRGMGMAANLADGITPAKVTEFRNHILKLRRNPKLYDLLHDRMNSVYGRVVIGLNGKMQPDGGMYYIIGPEAQFEKLAAYVAGAEGAQPIYRLYPRDYWIVD